MDMMTGIRQMQAEAFLKAGFTPDEVERKFGIQPLLKVAPIVVQAAPAFPVPSIMDIAPTVSRRKAKSVKAKFNFQNPEVLNRALQKAQATRKEKLAQKLARLRPIVEPARARGETWLQIANRANAAFQKDFDAAEVRRLSFLGGFSVEKPKVVKAIKTRGRKPVRELSEICVVLRQHLTAREIAMVLGVTRNAVIGHWFRARQNADT